MCNRRQRDERARGSRRALKTSRDSVLDLSWSLVVLLSATVLVPAAVAVAQPTSTVISMSSDRGQTGEPLIEGADGWMYGTTQTGGAFGLGTIFKVSPTGDYELLHSFDGTDGALPLGGLILTTSGHLYGTAQSGGDAGVIFRLAAEGSGFAVVYRFRRDPSYGSQHPDPLFPEGAVPQGPLLEQSDGSLAGVAAHGGVHKGGTIFQLHPNATLTVLHHFQGAAIRPTGGLTVGADGALYGVTAAENGTVYRFATGGGFELLHQLRPVDPQAGVYPDGVTPSGKLVAASDGSVYGVTTYGGAHGDGVIFRINPQGGYEVVHSFERSTTGNKPRDGLIEAPNATLYGTSALGGPHNSGVISGGTLYRLTLSSGAIEVVHAFSGIDGASPGARLLLHSNGDMYGTTYGGGETDHGVIFMLDTSFPPTCAAPIITQQPADREILSGDQTVLEVTASSDRPLQYQWHEFQGDSFVPLVGQVQAALVVAPVNTTRYKVRISNDCGETDSDVADVTVRIPPAPGEIAGTVSLSDAKWLLDGPAIVGLTVQALHLTDPSLTRSVNARGGRFAIEGLVAGYYRLRVRVVYTQSVLGNLDGCGNFVGEQARTDTRTVVRDFDSILVEGGSRRTIEVVLPPPIVLVHGIESGSTKWGAWADVLTDSGLMVITPNYEGRITKSNTWTVAQQTVQIQIVAALVRWTSAAGNASGYPRWHLVAHSQGGLVARVMATSSITSYNQALLNSAAGFVLLGTPNSGSYFQDTLPKLLSVCYSYLGTKAIESDFNIRYPSFGNIRTYAFAGDSFNGSDGVVAVEDVLWISTKCGGKKPCAAEVDGEVVPFNHLQLGSADTVDAILREKLLTGAQSIGLRD